jgi:hypothetical protein
VSPILSADPSPGRSDGQGRTLPGRVLIRTNYWHGREGCGERIPSPDWSCQASNDPYLVGERLVLPVGVIVVCNHCGAAWREAER